MTPSLPPLLPLLLLTTIACQTHTPSLAAPPATQPTSFPSVREFTCGNARITRGMTRQQVLEQITPPPPEMINQPTWTLSYGNSTGAAPGGGILTLHFTNNRLSQITPAAVYASTTAFRLVTTT